MKDVDICNSNLRFPILKNEIATFETQLNHTRELIYGSVINIVFGMFYQQRGFIERLAALYSKIPRSDGSGISILFWSYAFLMRTIASILTCKNSTSLVCLYPEPYYKVDRTIATLPIEHGYFIIGQTFNVSYGI